MPLINLSVEHGQTLEVARTRLERAVAEVVSTFGTMVHRVEWSADRGSVKLFGPGVEVSLWVDDREVHATGDVPLLGRLLAGPIRAILQRTFPKRLT